MSLDSTRFQAASEAAASWLNMVFILVDLGQRGCVDWAYEILMTTEGIDYNLQHSYLQHIEVLEEAKELLRAQSDSPVKWEHGRGLSAVARIPCVILPHIWSSAHEAAAEITGMALDMLVLPVAGITDPKEWWAVAEMSLTRFLKALKMTPDEVAELRERIRRERAKLLAHIKMADTAITTVASGALADMKDRPKKLLTGWHDICAALETPYAQREHIKSMNDRFDGPITNKGAGTLPMVYQDLLIEWWNRLAIQAQESTNRREGAKVSTEAQHNYGREGIVAPEIGGGVKKRRRDKRT
jgi:hypothetical protein